MSASPANPVICVVTVDISVNQTEDVPIHLHDDPEAVAIAFSARHSLPAEIEEPLVRHFSHNFAQAKARHDEALAAKRRLKSESTKSKHNRTSTDSSAFDVLQTTGTLPTNEQLTASGAVSAAPSAQADGADSLAPQPAYSPIAAHGSSSTSQAGFTLSSESASVVFGTAPLPGSAAPHGEERAEVRVYAGGTQPAASLKDSENVDAGTNRTSSSRRMTGDSEELEAMYAQLISAEASAAGAGGSMGQPGGKRSRAHIAGIIDIVPGRRSSGASSAGLCYTKEALMSASSQTVLAAKRQSMESLSGQTAQHGSNQSGPGQDAGTAASRKPPVARIPRVASLPPRAAAVPPPVPEITVGAPAAVARLETFQRLHHEAQARQARVKALADKVSISELQSIEAARRRMSGHDLPAVPPRLQHQAEAGSGPSDPAEASERLYAQAADLVTKRSKAAKALAIERAAVSEWMCPACCRPNSGRFVQCQQPSKGGKLHAGGRAGQGGKLCGAPRPAEENKPVISSFASRIQREMKASEPEYVDWSVAKHRDDKSRREVEAKKAAEEQLKIQATFRPAINPQSVQIAASFRDRRAQDVLPSGGASDIHSVLYAEGLLKRMHQTHALHVSGTGASKVKEVSSDLFNRLYAEGEELQAKLQAARSKAEQDARVAAAGRAGRVVSLPAEEASKLYALAAEKAAEKQSKLQAQLEEVDYAARAKHTSSKSEILLQGMRQKALAGVYQCLLQSTRQSSSSGHGDDAQAATQRAEAWSPGLLPQGQLDRLVCAIDVCGSVLSAGSLPEVVQPPVPVSAAKLEVLGDALLAAYVDKALHIMCCDKRGEQMTVSFEGFCGVLGRLVEEAGGGPHVYLHARKARKAAQVQKQIEEVQRKEQNDLTFAPAIDARSVQLVQQARARQSRSRSSSAAPPAQYPLGRTSEEPMEGPVDLATVQPVSRRSSGAHSYAPTDAPVHVRAHAQVYAVADKRRAAELDALRAQLAQHPFAPVLGPSGASAHSDAHPDQRTLQASKLQAAQLAARAKAVLRSEEVQQQAADLREHAAASAAAEHLKGALTIVGGVRMASGGAASQVAGMASGVSLGRGMTPMSAGTGTVCTGMGMGMGMGGQEQQAQPHYSPAPSLMSEGALDVLLQHDYHGRFSPLIPGASGEGEAACAVSPASTVDTGAREGTGKAGLARLASSASLLPRWTDGPDTDDTDGQGQSVGMVGSNDAIYGPLNTEEEDEAQTAMAAGVQGQKGAFALPPLPPSVGSAQSAQTMGQNSSARSSAPLLCSPRRFIAAKLEDYGYTPAKEEEEEEGGQEGEDHTTAPSNCENSAPEPALTSPGGRKALATTLFLSPASMAMGSTHAMGNNGGTLALAGTKLLMDQPEGEYSHSTALVVSSAGGGPQAGSLQALMQQLGIDALEERIAKLMQTVNTPIA